VRGLVTDLMVHFHIRYVSGDGTPSVRFSTVVKYPSTFRSFYQMNAIGIGPSVRKRFCAVITMNLTRKKKQKKNRYKVGKKRIRRITRSVSVKIN
jgi:hypothetical protein